MLHVRPGVFIPRPETEILVDAALAEIDGLEAPVVVDVGTGTGAIALSLAQEHPGASTWATDLATEAVTLARENAVRLDLEVTVVEGDLLQPLPARLRGHVDLVVSNPPYVTDDVYETLPPHVRADPALALRGGVEIYARLAAEAGGWLGSGGAIALEIGIRSGSWGERGAPRSGVRRCRRASRPGRARPGGDGAMAVSTDPVGEAIAAARRGALIVLPTDTVYGIGTRPDDPDATARVFEAKGRGRDLELPVLVATVREAEAVGVFDERAERLAAGCWPGGLTLVLARSETSREWDLGGDRLSVGVRDAPPPVGPRGARGNGAARREQREPIG